MSRLAELGLAWRIARRELRGGLRGFVVFLACIALGVAAIAAVGSINAGIVSGLERDARALLGGDIAIDAANAPITDEEIAALVPEGSVVARSVSTNAFAQADARRLPIALKAVDSHYPLYGRLALAPEQSPDVAFRDRGAVVEDALLTRLGVAIGDRLRIGETEVEIRGVILREPDRIGGYFAVGPRVLIDADTLDATAAIAPGSLARWSYRVALPEGIEPVAFAARLNADHGDMRWRARAHRDVEPRITRFTDRLATFLTLSGLTALLTGGLGVALATQSHLAGRRATIATLKCLGARGRLIFAIYLFQILTLAGLGTLVGLVLGQMLPLAVLFLPTELLPFDVAYGIYPLPLAIAAGCGLVTALVFAVWPLAQAREVPPAGLFRALVEPPRSLPRIGYLALLALALAVLATLAVVGVAQPMLGLVFVAVAAVSAVLLSVLAHGLLALLRRIGRRGPALTRMALANLHRPGSGAASVVVALSAGLTLLTMVAVLQVNLAREIGLQLPARAPSVFFIDIQPNQRAAFDDVVAGFEGATPLQQAAVVRGRVVRIAGRPAGEVEIDPEVAWTIRRDRGLSYAGAMPEGTELVAGSWWPESHDGPTQVSVDRRVAEGYGVGLGDTLAFNVLGRVIEAEITSLRDIDWSRARADFVFILSPGVLESAPQMWLATVDVAPDREALLIDAVADSLPNVTPISVRAIVASAQDIIARIGLAVAVVGGVTLASGVLVLAGAVAAARRRHLYETVVLKVLGARRIDLLRVYLLQYAGLGLVAALAAALLGTLGAWSALTWVIDLPFSPAPGAILRVTLLAVAVTLIAGGIGTWRLLGRPAGPVLRAA